MNDSNQPFTDLVTSQKTGLDHPRLPWVVAVVMAVAAIFFFCLWAALRANQPDIDSLRAKLQDANDSLAAAQAALQTNQDQIASLTNQLADLQQEKDQAVQASRGLEDEMKSDLESKDVTISKLQGKLTVTILDRLMFDSGEAVLKSDGAPVMRKIAAFLALHPELKIQVVGHTDNVPIRPSAHSRFASNWELSTARALAAVHFLTEQAGVDPRRVGAVGYGEFRPIADNSTPEGRAKNRRIAITIQSDELGDSESPQPPANAPTAGTTPPPPLAPPPVVAPPVAPPLQ